MPFNLYRNLSNCILTCHEILDQNHPPKKYPKISHFVKRDHDILQNFAFERFLRVIINIQMQYSNITSSNKTNQSLF